jgi:adenylate cyclase
MSIAGQSGRRLAAVLAADVAGYSSAVEQDEASTLSALRSLRQLTDGLLVEHGGRIANTAGDSIVAEFASTVQAVKCATAIQAAIGSAADIILRLRIGVHVGEVVPDGHDLLGETVNIAARLESMAAPGGVCISADVFGQVRKVIAVAFTDLGMRVVKGLASPIQVYATGADLALLSGAPMSVPARPSIAVLPFANLGANPEQEYFADGVVEDIITALSRVRWFFVIARNSSFTYKGRTVAARDVGRELGVRYVLEGSVRTAGSRIRINGHLVDATTGLSLWADRLDGGMEDIFDLQDRITESVVFAVEPAVLRVEIERARMKRPDSLTAYDLYLRALPEFQTYTQDGFHRARELLERAISIDPAFADARVQLADCLGRLLISGGLQPIEEGNRLVCETALRAVDVDPQNGAALAMAAWALSVAGNDPDRGAEFADRALQAHPNSAYVRMQSGFALLYGGQIERALENFTAALRFSPFDTRVYTILMGVAQCHLYAQRFNDAIQWAERALEKGPHFGVGYRVLAVAAARLGDQEKAALAIGRLLKLQPDFSLSLVRKRPFGQPWMFGMFLDGLRRAGLPE